MARLDWNSLSGEISVVIKSDLDLAVANPNWTLGMCCAHIEILEQWE